MSRWLHAAQGKVLTYDRAGDEHYGVVSALIKSLRGSDPDAAAYWMTRMLEAESTLNRLAERGYKLSIDDFGTGYSSLAYLKKLPVNELKIDKSFVMAMEREPGDAKIVRSTIDLAHNLGLSVVAEGVETAKAWKLLAGLNCDEIQGYFVAKPMPADTLADWLP